MELSKTVAAESGVGESWNRAFERFLRLTKPGPGECILWDGYINEYGYGQFWFGGKAYYAHRWIMLYLGKLKPGQDAAHKHDVCVGYACIWPYHLTAEPELEHRLGHLSRRRYG